MFVKKNWSQNSSTKVSLTTAGQSPKIEGPWKADNYSQISKRRQLFFSFDIRYSFFIAGITATFFTLQKIRIGAS